MYDELVKRLRESVGNRDEKCDCCPYEEDYPCCVDCLDKMHREAADAIEELSANMDIARSIATIIENEKDMRVIAQTSRWIPVTERLPEKDGWYQVYAPWYSGGSSSGLKNINGNMYSAFKHGKWSIEVGYHKRPGCVKAWMPFPEPPKEVDT